MYWLLGGVLLIGGWLMKTRPWSRVVRVVSVLLVTLLLVRGADAGRLRRHVQVLADQEGTWTAEFRDGARTMRDVLAQSNAQSVPLMACLVVWAMAGVRQARGGREIDGDGPAGPS